MKLSIIMSSFNRPQLLEWGLSSWIRQKITCSYEIIILNDYLQDDETREVCNKFRKKLNIHYIFTGQRNTLDNIKWRIPGYALNIGVKQSKGKYIILTSPEIYLIENDITGQVMNILSKENKVLVIPDGSDDVSKKYLDILKLGNKINLETYYKFYHKLHTEMPFFMGIIKQEYLDIHGYDEDFIGFAFEDADFVERLKLNNNGYWRINSHIIHLHHSRKRYNRIGLKDYNEQYKYNKNLYYKKQGIIIRNTDKEWGKL